MQTKRWSVPAWLPDAGLLILRMGFGAYLFTHGWPKLVKLFEGNGGAFPDPIGIGPVPSLAIAAIAETLGATLLAVGVAARPTALFLAGVMAVAAFATHGGDPYTMGEGARLFKAGLAKAWSSKEPALLYGLSFLALACTGAGRFTLGALIARRKD